MQSKIRNYAGRSSMPAVDLLDYLKKETIKEIFDRRDSIEFASEDERLAVLKFRTERLTLERLLEIKEQFSGAGVLSALKTAVSAQINSLNTGNILGLNDDYQRIIASMSEDQLSYVPADSLVNLFERLSLGKTSQESASNIFLYISQKCGQSA